MSFGWAGTIAADGQGSVPTLQSNKPPFSSASKNAITR
jgi:hypothetical protein